jgi:hypothetical protein
VAGLLNEKIISLAHVGDSRAYLFRDGQLSRLTDDHSWVHEQVTAGILTEEEAKTHPLKNVVTRALGGGPSVSPDLQELVFSPGDRFLFCSDGLTTMVSDEEIHDTAATVPEPQPLCQKLVDMATEKGEGQHHGRGRRHRRFRRCRASEARRVGGAHEACRLRGDHGDPTKKGLTLVLFRQRRHFHVRKTVDGGVSGVYPDF